MSTIEPADLSISEAIQMMRMGQLNSVELTTSCLDRIAKRDRFYGAWTNVYHQQALAEAEAADVLRAQGSERPLLGIPVGLKDVIAVEGRPLTADSAMLAGNVADEDSEVWSKLEDSGMVLIGHLHCGEFANGVSGVNPWGESVSPGGSSSGSAIALAARMVPATIGTDARGSIRIPASFNGITGFKPTFGSVSTRGCIPISFSYDTIGPMARCAADCARLMQVLDQRDEYWGAVPARSSELPAYPIEPRAGKTPLRGVKIGIPEFYDRPISAGVATIFEAFQETMVQLGAQLVHFPWPDNPLQGEDKFLGDWLHILGGEAEAIHEQFAGAEHLYRDDFRGFIDSSRSSGTRLEYLRAQMKRSEYIEHWKTLFSDYDLTAVVHPLSQMEPFRTDAPLDATTFSHVMAACWNDLNFPAISVPAGRSTLDLTPIGMQLAGRPFSDPVLLQIAIDYQAHTDHHREQPDSLDAGQVFEPQDQKHSQRVMHSYRPVMNPFSSLSPDKSI